MDALSITQTIFYAVASVVLIVLGGFLVAAAWKLFIILREAKDMADGIKQIYDKVKRFTDKFGHSSKQKRK